MTTHEDAPLYELAASEIASGKADRGIFAKAFSVALGEDEKSRALYIQYRVEQLKAQISRLAHEEARASAGGRKAYLAELKQRFDFISRASFPEATVSSDAFLGDSHSLPASVPLSDVSDAIGMLEFRLIDAVKAGLVYGILDRDGDWWLSAKNA